MSEYEKRSFVDTKEFDHDLLEGLPLGVIAGDYTPAGEYHVVPALADSGRWRETVLHYSFRKELASRGNWQIVREADGQDVLEQTIKTRKPLPTLVTGEESWLVRHFEFEMHPWTADGTRRILLGYKTGLRHIAIEFADGLVRLIDVVPFRETVLEEARFGLSTHGYLRARLICDDNALHLEINGTEALFRNDRTLMRKMHGGIGVSANDLTRFRKLRAKITESVASTPPRLSSNGGTRHLNRDIKPKLWRTLSTNGWGTDRNLRFGNISNQHGLDIVMATRSDRLGSDNFSSISSLAAFDLEGELLWAHGSPSNNKFATTNDLCFQVHDLDGDGADEVVFAQDWSLYVIDPISGGVKAQAEMPVNSPHVRQGAFRALGDSISFCDLTGRGRHQDILLKDRYRQLWALDKDLTIQWTFEGNLGHYPYVYDVDGDGRHEVFIGHHLLDGDGSELWGVSYPDHSDNVAVITDPRNGTNKHLYLIAGSDAGYIVLNDEGHEILRHNVGHAQSMCVANLLPDRPGVEVLVNTYWGRVGMHFLMDEVGNILHDFEPIPYASLLQPVNWVPARGDEPARDLVLLSTHPRQGGLIDGTGERVVEFPDDGHPVMCSAVVDIDGDGIDEILTWDENEIWIYKADVPGRNPGNYPRRNPNFNESNYRAQVSLPALR